MVAADQDCARDGRFLEILGHYNPRDEPATIVVDEARMLHWLGKGAHTYPAFSGNEPFLIGGATLLPIDSEHSAIFQSLPEDPATWAARIDKIILTASGGPFRTRAPASLRAVTPEMAKAGEAMLWASYDALRCPTLLLRGADSDLLSAATAQAMTQRGPKARLQEFAGVGHAPMLDEPEAEGAILGFLAELP